MEIRDLKSFKELTISETSKIIGGNKIIKSIKKAVKEKYIKGGNTKNGIGQSSTSCDPKDWITPPDDRDRSRP